MLGRDAIDTLVRFSYAVILFLRKKNGYENKGIFCEKRGGNSSPWLKPGDSLPRRVEGDRSTFISVHMGISTDIGKILIVDVPDLTSCFHLA